MIIPYLGLSSSVILGGRLRPAVRRFLKIFDGFSIRSNDLTQLTLDRDSGLVANLFDERDPAVKMLLAMAISAANISLNPDTVVDPWTQLASHKKA